MRGWVKIQKRSSRIARSTCAATSAVERPELTRRRIAWLIAAASGRPPWDSTAATNAGGRLRVDSAIRVAT